MPLNDGSSAGTRYPAAPVTLRAKSGMQNFLPEAPVSARTHSVSKSSYQTTGSESVVPPSSLLHPDGGQDPLGPVARVSAQVQLDERAVHDDGPAAVGCLSYLDGVGEAGACV